MVVNQNRRLIRTSLEPLGIHHRMPSRFDGMGIIKTDALKFTDNPIGAGVNVFFVSGVGTNRRKTEQLNEAFERFFAIMMCVVDSRFNGIGHLQIPLKYANE